MGESSHLSTFVVADLVGYTALTEAHGDSRAADVAADFCRLVRGRLEAFAAEEVKALGDGLLMHVADPVAAVLLAERLLSDVVTDGHPLGVRIGTRGRRSTGMATGSARRSTSPAAWRMSRRRAKP